MSTNRKRDIEFKHYGAVVNVLFISLVLIVASISSILTQVSPAYAVGNMYITPASGSVINNGNIILNLRINPTTAVTVVEATVGFNPASLQFVSINSSSSPFDATVQQTVSSSTIKIARAKLDSAGVSTDALIASITFKALPYTGSSPVTLTAANAAYDGAYTNPSASGATVNFTPGSCPAGQTGTPPSCTTTPATTGGGTTATSPAPSKTTTSKPQTTTITPPQPAQTAPATTDSKGSPLEVPVISNQNTQYTILSITATTNMPARTYLVYGISRESLNVQTPLTESGKTHTHSVAKGLSPGARLFYKIVATDGTSTKESITMSVSLKGVSVKVALLDKNMKKISNQKVTLLPSNLEATSDDNGSIVFSDIAPNDYIVRIVKEGKAFEQHITVVSNVVTDNGTQTSEQQLQAVVFDDYVAPVSWLPVWAWYVGGAILAFIALCGFALHSWRKNGIVRNWYARARDRGVNQKLNGVALGGFAPAIGLSATPNTVVGSRIPYSTNTIAETPSIVSTLPSPSIPQVPLRQPTIVNSEENYISFDSQSGDRHV